MVPLIPSRAVKLNSPLPEYQRRPVHGDADERQPHEAARLLSGNLPQFICRIRPHVLSSGWNRHLYEQCEQDAGHRSDDQIEGHDVRLQPQRPY